MRRIASLSVVYGEQKIMKILTRKCKAFLGRRPFCRPPLTPAASAGSPATPATEAQEGHDSAPSAHEDSFVSRFDVAEGRRLLGRFVVVKGPTLLEDEQGAVLRVREAGAAGQTMVRHPTSEMSRAGVDSLLPKGVRPRTETSVCGSGHFLAVGCRR